MAIKIRSGRSVSASGIPLALIDVPPVSPELNISLIDRSYSWDENVANIESAEIATYVPITGVIPSISVKDFLVSNYTTVPTNDIPAAPLYYKHLTRFYHYSFGESPFKNIYITDVNGVVLRGINYRIALTRQAPQVYRVEILTDFQNNSYSQYRVKYNRCNATGGDIFASWEETINPVKIFQDGNPFADINYYSVAGPDVSNLYTVTVPPVPSLSNLVNYVGISFEQAPTSVINSVTTLVDYVSTVTYTLRAVSSTTFSVKRDKLPSGAATTDIYLQNAAANTWGAGEVAFSTGSTITGVPGLTINVYADSYLVANDQAQFTAGPPLYYLKPIAYNAIYVQKPQYVTPDDDWYVKIRAGRFRRRMDANGNVVPSGFGTLYEYYVPEYDFQLFDFTYGKPYRKTIGERAEVLDRNTIQLQNAPLQINQEDVLTGAEIAGFPPSGNLAVFINDQKISQDSILDWDSINGTVRVAPILNQRDDVIAEYVYEENFYEYNGFIGSGAPFPVVEPLPYFQLDLNPTPEHNIGMYASGIVANIFLKPFLNVDTGSIINSDNALYHRFEDSPYDPLDFKLASISLGLHARPRDVEVTDVRTRGGGLNERGREHIDDVLKVQPEAEFFWDVGYFDGKAFPANGVLIIDVPKRVLISNGGSMTEDEVRIRVMKHVALGEYPIINYVE